MDIFGRVTRRIAKVRRGLISRVASPVLERRARRSSESLIDPENNVVVCLTSYGQRLDTVHLTVESIGRGRARPARLILWTDPGVDADTLSAALQRQRARGLEILASPERYGPHTKYYPYVASVSHHEAPLVTADDDSIYPRLWLSRLQTAALRHDGEIVCYRAHRVGFMPDGAIAPYNSWKPVKGTDASALNFATGVSGVHYPPAFLDELRADGEVFQDCTPKADDVWLHYRAISHGRLVRQIVSAPRKYPEVASTQDVALHRSNTAQSGNDGQIAATYDDRAVQVMLSERRRS